jgi:glyoxylase-like metal-dependent hydrolase (beta-lactamase superfamily II)
MQLTTHVHALKLPFKIPVAPGIDIDRFVYVFLIYGKTITLIDTGVTGCENTLFEYITSTGRKPAQISLIIQTHAHPDHIEATYAIQRATGCNVAVHAAEKLWIENVAFQNRERPVPGFFTLVGNPVKVAQVLHDGDIIDLDGDHTLDLIVFHTPGHSPGSISLLLKSDGALFSGDAIPVLGGIPVYDDVTASVQSIRRLDNIDGIKILLSAWDDPREGILVYQRMHEALWYLQRIHEAVIAAAASNTLPDPMGLCRTMAAALRLPPLSATPLLARTFSANLKVRDRKNLLIE